MSNYTFDSDSLKYFLNKLKELFTLNSEADLKVDQVNGKDLVTNDYTDEHAQLNNKIINDIAISDKTDTEITLTFSRKNGDSSSIRIPYDKYKKSALFVDAPEKFLCLVDEENKINYRYISSLKDGNHRLVVEIVKSTGANVNYQESYTYDEIPDYYLYIPGEEDIALRMYFIDSENTMTGITYLEPEIACLVAEYILNEINDNAYPDCNDGSFTNFVTNDIQNDDSTFTRTMITGKEGPTKIDFRNTAGLTKINRIGPTITNMTNAFSECSNLTGSPVCGDNVIDMTQAYDNCYSLTGSPVCGDNVVNMYSTYNNCCNLTGSPVCRPSVTNFAWTYRNCTNLTGNPVCGDKVTDMADAYYQCPSLTGSPVCGPNVTNMSGAYTDCSGLTGNPVCGNNVTDMGYTYQYCYGITGSPVCGDNVTTMTSTYWDCRKLTGSPVCGPNVTMMAHTYWNCSNLTGAPVCGPNVTSMINTYYKCRNLYGDMYVYSDNISNATNCFYGRNNSRQLNISVNFGTKSHKCFTKNTITALRTSWTNAGDGSIYCWNDVANIVIFNMQTTNMYNAFIEDTTITKAACGPNVTSMTSAYSGCINLTGSPVCGPSVINMSNAYEYCSNLTGSPVCGPSVINMSATYADCSNLTGSPVCGDKVTDMSNAYFGCSNLTGSPVCGDKVSFMYCTYFGCSTLTGSPACGNNVTDMDSAYEMCIDLTGSAICGPNVIYMNHTYSGCTNLGSNGYFYSNKVAHACECFYDRDISKRLNLYVPANSLTLNTCLSNSSSTSLTGTSITWINDTANNRYYNTAQNIYIYPVANVEKAYKDNEN